MSGTLWVISPYLKLLLGLLVRVLYLFIRFLSSWWPSVYPLVARVCSCWCLSRTYSRVVSLPMCEDCSVQRPLEPQAPMKHCSFVSFMWPGRLKAAEGGLSEMFARYSGWRGLEPFTPHRHVKMRCLMQIAEAFSNTQWLCGRYTDEDDMLVVYPPHLPFPLCKTTSSKVLSGSLPLNALFCWQLLPNVQWSLSHAGSACCVQR